MIKTLIGAVLVASLATGAAVASTPEILVAHRGFGGDAQVKYRVAEHSLPAYSLAIQKAKANIYVDLDAQWSKDGVMITMHDRNIKRTTNGYGNVDQLTASYITGRWLEIPVDVNGNGDYDNVPYHPPTIKQSLDFLKSKTVAGEPVKITIELKGGLWTQIRVNRLKTVLENRNLFSSRVNVHSFNNTYAKYAKIAGFPNVGFVAPSAGPLPSVSAVKAVGGNVFVKHTLMTQAAADMYNDAGIKIWMWTADEPAEYSKAIKYQIYALVTDDLVEAQDYLEQAA